MPGICHIGERCGLRLRGVALDDEGVLPDALDAACRSEPARLLVLNPTIHNPTTATMSAERCRAIAALAREHDLIVVEDDVYGRLPEQRAPPIAALAPERTIYITSASKSMAPGLRLGMLLCPQRYLEPIAEAQHDLFLTCPPLMAELFKLWQGNGTAQRAGAAPAGRGARAAGPGARDPGQSRVSDAADLLSPLAAAAAALAHLAVRRRRQGARRGGRSGLGVRGRSRPGAARGADLAQRRQQPRAPAKRPCDPGGAARRAARPAPRGDLERPEAAICRPRLPAFPPALGSVWLCAPQRHRISPRGRILAWPCALRTGAALRSGQGSVAGLSDLAGGRQKVGAAWWVLPQ